MKTISIDHSRKELLPMVLLGFIMFAASVWLLYAGLFTNYRTAVLGSATSGVGIFAGGLGTLFFGYAFFYLLYRAMFPKGALLITDQGIIDRTNAIGSKDLIPFENMKKAKLEIVNASPQIGINLYNEEEYLKSLPYIKRKAQSINKNSFGTSMVSLNVPADSREDLKDLIAIINERIERVQDEKESMVI